MTGRGARATHGSAGAPVWAIVFALTVAALLALAVVLPPALRELRGGLPAVWAPLLFATGFGLSDRFLPWVPVRNQRFYVGISDFALVIALVFFDPAVLVLAVCAGAAVGQWAVFTQVTPIKRLFNAAQYTVSGAVAALVSAGLLEILGGTRPGVASGRLDLGLMLGVVAGATVYLLVNQTLVVSVVWLSSKQRMPWRGWVRLLQTSLITSAVSIVYGLVAATLIVYDWRLLPLLVVPLAVTVFGLRAWLRTLATSQRLHSLYLAGRALANQPGDAKTAWSEFVDHIPDVLTCEGGAVFLGRPEGKALEVVATDREPERVRVSPSPSAWEQAARGFAGRSGWARALMVPMEAEGRAVGYACAFGPRVDAEFSPDDRETLLALANQAAAALLNEELYREAESERAALGDIVSHSTDGIYTVGPDRSIRSWNPAMVALTGYDEEEAIGQRCFNLLRARDGKGADMCASDCPILAAAASGQKEVRDVSVLNKEGRNRWIQYAHAPIVNPTGQMEADVVVVRDVTREREAEELKADFVASVSHELRTPLTPIKGFLLTLVRADDGLDEGRRAEYYRMMLRQTERLEQLIEDLLEVTRLESSTGLIDSSAIDALDLVRDVVDRFAAEQPGRPVEVVVPDHPVYCRGDWLRIDQVLGNLLGNALRYSPPEAPVEVRVVPGGREVVFEVHDFGPGIPKDQQARIFERFHRVGHYLTREPGGAGLGLYLARRLVEAMGGRIWMRSRLGSGSVFAFALPSEPHLGLVPAPGDGSEETG